MTRPLIPLVERCYDNYWLVRKSTIGRPKKRYMFSCPEVTSCRMHSKSLCARSYDSCSKKSQPDFDRNLELLWDEIRSLVLGGLNSYILSRTLSGKKSQAVFPTCIELAREHLANRNKPNANCTVSNSVISDLKRRLNSNLSTKQ